LVFSEEIIVLLVKKMEIKAAFNINKGFFMQFCSVN